MEAQSARQIDQAKRGFDQTVFPSVCDPAELDFAILSALPTILVWLIPGFRNR
jgi:hypothetical protein